MKSWKSTEGFKYLNKAVLDYVKDIGRSDLTDAHSLRSDVSPFFTGPECPVSQCPVLILLFWHNSFKCLF